MPIQGFESRVHGLWDKLSRAPREDASQWTRPWVISHRGSTDEAPENSVDAFGAALAKGAEGAEFDVRYTGQRNLFVIHNPNLSDGRIVCRLSDADAADEGLATIDEVIDALARTAEIIDIEIKNDSKEPDFDEDRNAAADVIRAIARHGIADRAVVTSFDLAMVDAVKAQAPEIQTGWLVSRAGGLSNRRILDICEKNGHDVCPKTFRVTRRFVAQAGNRGIDVYPYVANDPRRIMQLAEWGVRGIITDDVDAAIQMVDQVEAAMRDALDATALA